MIDKRALLVASARGDSALEVSMHADRWLEVCQA